MKRLEPSSTYSSPSRRASLRIAARVGARAGLGQRVGGERLAATRAAAGSAASARRLPASLNASAPSSCTARISPLVAQTFEISSIETNVISALAPIAAVLLVGERREDAVLAEELDDVPRELGRLVDLGRARRDPLAGERAHEVADLALLGRQRIVRHTLQSSSAAADKAAMDRADHGCRRARRGRLRARRGVRVRRRRG